jgi:hypothetical protein
MTDSSRWSVWLAAVAGLAFASPGVRADEPKVADLNQLRLYVPIPELTNRVGKDVKPLADYIKALERATVKFLERAEKPKAKGLLIAVGIKAGRKSKVWCQAVEGDAPAELLQTLEKELAKVEAVALERPPMAFAMEVNLWGRRPKQYPAFPDAWLEAAKKTKSKLLVPPDDLFKSIWPD